MHLPLRIRLAGLTLAVAASACGSDSPTAPITEPATLDQALSELSLPALSAAGGSFAGSLPDLPTLGLASCPYAALSQSFVCTPVSSSGVTIEQSFTLLTASGDPQSAFDQATTDAVQTNTIFSGTVSDAGSTLAIDGDQELTLSGLRTGPHVLNGSAFASISGTLANGTSSLPIDVTVTSSITNLVLPVNPAPGTQLWPTSGTIVVESAGSFAGFPTTTTRMTMVFDGTSSVSLTITGSGTSQTCRVNLATSEPSCG